MMSINVPDEIVEAYGEGMMKAWSGGANPIEAQRMGLEHALGKYNELLINDETIRAATNAVNLFIIGRRGEETDSGEKIAIEAAIDSVVKK